MKLTQMLSIFLIIILILNIILYLAGTVSTFYFWLIIIIVGIIAYKIIPKIKKN